MTRPKVETCYPKIANQPTDKISVKVELTIANVTYVVSEQYPLQT